MTQFEEAAKYAVSKLDKRELSEALGIMYETNLHGGQQRHR